MKQAIITILLATATLSLILTGLLSLPRPGTTAFPACLRRPRKPAEVNTYIHVTGDPANRRAFPVTVRYLTTKSDWPFGGTARETTSPAGRYRYVIVVGAPTPVGGPPRPGRRATAGGPARPSGASGAATTPRRCKPDTPPAVPGRHGTATRTPRRPTQPPAKRPNNGHAGPR
ncbi:hypothetical protein [Sphaerisporangium sp. TRM90804]|uniref:hypothetical protein n=1 Tax=Sphaerisporangium sp. TRM90804 TaxID=3031113 RepID=UPI0024474A82|nr:hypothetical protein [Sphaerisporangium sp. TRM90804]MDH2430767.1 hypothetical protein [Sphaerisporangium sp. TRM90804]